MISKEELQRKLKMVFLQTNNNQSTLAKKLGVARNSISKKMVNFSWRYIDLVNLLDELGYDVIWVKRDKNNQAKQ